ncbi:hypothetical protein JIR23_06870 [Bradyrhizobium diazoefficiens]|nr:hypothetical protein JIR23_06870 [Bradyrhizobium diazoefficiens]
MTALAAAAGEQPGLAAERDAAQLALGGVVGEADPAVGEEAREYLPALKHVVHGLGDVGVPREPGAFGAHPGLQIGKQRRSAHARSASRSVAGRPLISRSTSKIASMRFTASNAIGAIAASLPRALAVTSASTKNLRRACAQLASG